MTGFFGNWNETLDIQISRKTVFVSGYPAAFWSIFQILILCIRSSWFGHLRASCCNYLWRRRWRWRRWRLAILNGSYSSGCRVEVGQVARSWDQNGYSVPTYGVHYVGSLGGWCNDAYLVFSPASLSVRFCFASQGLRRVILFLSSLFLPVLDRSVRTMWFKIPEVFFSTCWDIVWHGRSQWISRAPRWAVVGVSALPQNPRCSASFMPNWAMLDRSSFSLLHTVVVHYFTHTLGSSSHANIYAAHIYKPKAMTWASKYMA